MNCPEGARETTLGCAPTENDQNPFAACGRQTLRGFFDTLWGGVSAPPGSGQQPQPQLPQPLLFSHPPPHPPQKVSRRIRQMIHQQLPPKPLLFPHIEATSVCFLEHPLLVPCYSAGEKMCGNIAENYSPAPGRSPIPRMRGTAERQALPPAFMRGEGREAAGGVPRRSGESLLSHGCAVPAPPEGKPRALRTVLAPAFMRGEGHAVAGGVPRRGGESLLSHGFAVPALPKGEPRALRTVLAPRIYEGGGPRSGGGSPPPQRGRPSQSRFACQLSQRESQGSCAPITGHSEPVLLSGVRISRMRGTAERQALPPAFMRGEGHAVAGGVPPPQRGRPSQSRLRRAGSPKERAKGAAP